MKQHYLLAICLPLSLLFVRASLTAQRTTFQHLLYTDRNVQLFDGDASPDGGYVFGGIAEDGTVSRPIMIKMDCTGAIDWVKTLGPSSTIQNVFTRVAITPDSGAVMVANVGQFNAYSIVVLRVDKNGATLWRKIINQGLGDDGGFDIAPTTDGGFVLTGYTNTFGTESPGGSYRDAYLIKLNGNGDLEWARTYGNRNAYDEGTSVIQTGDGGYAVCGRFIDQGTFYAFLLKTDDLGNPEFMRTYGDTLHANRSFAVRELSDGGFVMVGSTTLLQQNFQSYPDNFILRTNPAGDTLWTVGFYGLPNSFENPSSLLVDDQENFIVGVATSSYPTTGFVPNKQMTARFSPAGALQTAKLYNSGGSHYPVIAPALDDGYLITGFTNAYLGLNFTGLVIKTDANLDAGCYMRDVTFQTLVSPLPMRVRTPVFSMDNGAIVANYSLETTLALQDSILCETAAPPLMADFSVMPGCIGDLIQFTNESTQGAGNFTWNFGDPASGSANTSTLDNPAHTFTVAGNYMVQLTISDGCRLDSIEQTIAIGAPPLVDLGPDTTLCSGETYTLNAGNADLDYLWNTGDTGQTLAVQDSGLYTVQVSDGICTGTDSVTITTKICDLLALPNAFTPNGDGDNDVWAIIHSPDYTIRQLMIFNRWGEMMYQAVNTSAGWDGKFNGYDAPSDVYAFVAELAYKGTTITKKGDITLLR